MANKDIYASYPGASHNGRKIYRVERYGSDEATITTKLGDLNDVTLTDLATGDKIYYSLTEHKWYNKPDTTYNLVDVDVDPSTLVEGQLLVWNDTTKKFENRFTDVHELKNYVTTIASAKRLVSNTTEDQVSLIDDTINNLTDVEITSPTSNDFLMYDGTTSIWRNIAAVLDQLSDVVIVDAADLQVLRYEAATSTWKNKDEYLDDLYDVVINAPTALQVVRYDATTNKFVNKDEYLTDLYDVVVTTPLDKQVLRYDALAEAWVNTTQGLDDLDDIDLTGRRTGCILKYNASTHKYEHKYDVLDQIEDVVITTPSEGQVLSYNETLNTWVNGSMDLNDLTDVTITTPITNKSIIEYDVTTGKWKNVPRLKLRELSDVHTTTLVDGDMYIYDVITDKFVNRKIRVKDIEDVQYSHTRPFNNSILTYDSAAEKWTDKQFELNDLSDVVINPVTLAGNDVIKYDSTVGKWTNATAVGIEHLGELLDVDTSAAVNGDSLVYNAVANTWVGRKPAVSELRDTVITEPVIDDILIHNGTSWVNKKNSVANLSDTVITTPANGEALVYNSDSKVWINKPVSSKLNELEDVDVTTTPLAQGYMLRWDDTQKKWLSDPMNVTEVGAVGKYIRKIRQDNGKISAAVASFDSMVTADSTNDTAPTSMAVYNSIHNLYFAEEGGDGRYVKKIKQEDGKISADLGEFDPFITSSPSVENAPTSNAVKYYSDSHIVGIEADMTTAPTDGQIMKYDGTSKKWKPADASTATIPTLYEYTIVWNITPTGYSGGSFRFTFMSTNSNLKFADINWYLRQRGALSSYYTTNASGTVWNSTNSYPVVGIYQAGTDTIGFVWFEGTTKKTQTVGSSQTFSKLTRIVYPEST